MTTPSQPKLPGWTRRGPELTPPIDIWAGARPANAIDVDTFLDPANDVAYKMIGGAYGVLGAEVLGHFVPQVLDPERWGIYIREAGIAWLCGQLGPRLTPDPSLLRGLVSRLARAVAAHHVTHHVVEQAITERLGRDAYQQILASNAPRHPASEEALADDCYRQRCSWVWSARRWT